MQNHDPNKHRMPRWMACVLLMGNLLILVFGCVLQEESFRWFDKGAAPSAISFMVMVSAIGFATLLSSWGPGSLLIRVLALGLVICLVAGIQVVCVYILQNLVHDSNRMPAGVAMQLASQIGNGLSIAVPMMIILTMLAALGKWRIGPPSLPPIRMRIVELMAGTAAVASLLVMNSEIQYRFYEVGFSQDENVEMLVTTGWLGTSAIHRGDYASVGEYRFEIMLLATITAPFAAMVTATAAWSLLNRYAWIGVLPPMVLLGTLAIWAIGGGDALTTVGILFSVFIACVLIAINVRLVGRAGWPLSKRLAATLPEQCQPEMPRKKALSEI